MAVSDRLKRWLQARGILPDNESLAIAALAISLEDWKRELRKSIRKQKRSQLEEDDE